jgi:hypothetical protein
MTPPSCSVATVMLLWSITASPTPINIKQTMLNLLTFQYLIFQNYVEVFNHVEQSNNSQQQPLKKSNKTF